MLRRARSAGSHQRHPAHLAHGTQLSDIVAPAHSVARHAVEYDFARAAPLCLDDPVQGASIGVACALDISGELLDSIVPFEALAVHAHHPALSAEATAQFVYQFRTLERRRIDRDFLRAGRQHLLRLRHRADASGHAERDIQSARHARHPGAVHAAPLRARGNVIEHQLIRTLVAVAGREFQDIADDPMIAKAHALDDHSVADIETGDYAFGKNGCKSSMGMSSSRSALPLMAVAAPASASACRSRASRMPPDACHWICG